MADVINYRFRVRRGLAATWSGTNPVPLDGEISWERDTGRFKIGDGATDFNALLYHGIGKVDITGLADGYVLKWDATNGKWIVAAESGGGGGGGDFSGPASSTDNALVRFDGGTGKAGQGSGVLVSDNDEISGYRGHLNQQTGTSYTLQSSDAGKIVELSNAAAIALTADPTLPKGFACTIVQGGSGQVTIASTGSGTVVNRQSHTKTAGQNAMVALYVRSNSGSDAVFVIGGDTA